MATSDCCFFKNSFEFRPGNDYRLLRNSVRGIYVLFNSIENSEHQKKPFYDVVYVGLSGIGKKAGIKSRLRKHLNHKNGRWTHFSAYEVWDNITDLQIKELEGLFRHIYQHDQFTQSLNFQRTYPPLKQIKRSGPDEWK